MKIKKMNVSPWISLLALTFALVAHTAKAQVAFGDPFVITDAPDKQSLSAAAYNSVNNGFLVVWGDLQNTAVSGADINGQRLTSTGTSIGSPIPVSQDPGQQPRPAIGYSPVSNRYLVVFTYGGDIYAQIATGEGNLVGANFPLVTAKGLQNRPSVAHDPVNDRYCVVWEDARTNKTNDAYGQLVGPDGTLVGENFLISGAPEAQERVEVTYNSASQQFLSVWADFRNRATTGGDVQGQWIDSSGTLIDANFPIVTAAGDQFRPHLAYDEVNNSFLLAFTDCRNNVLSGCTAHKAKGTDIYAKLLAGDGTPIGSDIPIATDPAPSYRSLVAFNPLDQLYLIAWVDGRNRASSQNDIFVQAANADGTLLGGNTGLVTPAGQERGDVVYNPAQNNFLVTYTHSDRSTGVEDIHGRFVTVTP